MSGLLSPPNHNASSGSSNSPTKPSVTLIRLVNGENTSRPFLRINDVQHITLNNFGTLINETPFQKFNSSSSTTHTPLYRVPSSSAPSLGGPSDEIQLSHKGPVRPSPRKWSLETPSSILKDAPRSRFNTTGRGPRGVSDTRRVTIATNLL